MIRGSWILQYTAKKFEDGCRMIYAGAHSFFGLVLEEVHVPIFWLLQCRAHVSSRLPGPKDRWTRALGPGARRRPYYRPWSTLLIRGVAKDYVGDIRDLRQQASKLLAFTSGALSSYVGHLLWPFLYGRPLAWPSFHMFGMAKS